MSNTRRQPEIRLGKMSIAVTIFRKVRDLAPASSRENIERMYFKVLEKLPLKTRIAVQYYRSFRSLPDFKNPKTFNEKCQWQKIQNDQRLPRAVNKITAKLMAAERIGPDHITPTLYSGDFLPTIDQRTWPTPYVIKANHGSGSNIFIRTEADKDWPRIESKLREWLSYSYGKVSGEMFYSGFKPQVLVEPFIGENGEQPIDYKVFVFNGVPKYIQLDTDRATNHKRTIYDTDWNKQPFMFKYPVDERGCEKPALLRDLLDCAAKLAEGFGFMRADFYVIGNRVIFGEMTFMPEAGLAKFTPNDVDRMMGDMWHITPTVTSSSVSAPVSSPASA